jgi:NAD(P)-dependent dehydrogenase (short-subunit alcohol dehydrogenase family)
MNTTSHTEVPPADPAAHLTDTEARSPDTHERQRESEARREQAVARPAEITGSLKGRIALVTGGNRGIGSAICRLLGASGATVAAGYGHHRDEAEAFAHELEQSGTEVSIHQGNVGSAEDCRRVVTEVVEQHGSIDILVNNAGITIDKPVLKMSDEDWYKVLAVNLSGAFFMSQAGLPHMIDQGGGRIVNISSIIGQQGNIGQANYAASKSGLFGLTTTLAREAAKAMAKADQQGPECRGVTVNTVAPGFIRTEMVESVPEKVLEKIVAKIPAGRLGEPDEVARIVLFLCEDASSYITGQVYGVNGGMEMAGA